MAENCLNCSHTITENFCGNCGQKKYKRIDRKYIIDELQYSFVHTNKGFFYSLKNIIKNPGKTAKAFVDGNRVNHYKPLLLAFVLSGISAFISFKVIGVREMMDSMFAQEDVDKTFMESYMSFMASYHAFIMLLMIPFFAISTKIGFWKWGHNYYEHIILNAIILSFYTVVTTLIVSPLMYVFRHDQSIFRSLTGLSSLLMPFILVWFFRNVYPDKSLKSIIFRVLLILALVVVIISILIIIGVVGYLGYLIAFDPEMLQKMQKK